MGGGEVRQETASADAVNRGGIAPGDAYAALQTKLEELDAYTHNVLHQFPRVERHLLCSDMRGAMNRMQRLLATAWKRKQKAAALFDMDVEIEVFRGQVRKACRLQYITPQRLDVWMQHTHEIPPEHLRLCVARGSEVPWVYLVAQSPYLVSRI